MDRGIAFIHAIGMFGYNNITKEEMLDLLRHMKDERIKIIGMYGNDNIIFEKSKELHYASVGNIIERMMNKKFHGNFKITTRSLRTVKGIVSVYG